MAAGKYYSLLTRSTRNFDTLVMRIMLRAASIKRSDVVKMWHHCALEWFNYMKLQAVYA